MDSQGGISGDFWSGVAPEAARDGSAALVSALDTPVSRLDADGRIVALNDAARELLGVDDDGVVGDHVSSILDDDATERVTDTVDVLLETPEDVATFDAVLRTGTGDTVRRELTVTPLVSDGTHHGTVLVASDPAQDAGGAGETAPETDVDEVFGRVSDAFFALDDDFTFTHLNERAHELINPEDRDLIGENVWDAFPAATDREFKEQYERAMREQETVSFEEYYPDPLDTWFEVRAYPSETGLSVYFRDVTERKEHERRYRTLAENFPNGAINLFDDDLRYTLAAGQVFDELDVDASDLEGAHVREVWDDETADALEPVYRAAIEDGERNSLEITYAEREFVVYVLPVTDEEDNVFAGMTMAQDITERKERERQLEDAKSQFEAAAEAGAIGTWEWHVPSDEFVADASFAHAFDVDSDAAREGVSLDRFVSAIHEDDRPRVERKIQDALDSCGDYEAEYRVWNADGELRWVVARGHVECDEDGNPVSFPGALTDITERKQMEQTLSKYETIVETIDDGIYLLDEDDCFTMMNDAYADLVGYDRNELLGMNATEVVSEETLAEGRRIRENVAPDEDATPRMETELETASGDTVPVEATFATISSGDTEERVGVVRDISNRIEQRRKLAESERRYRTLVENFPNGAVALFDENLQYTAVGGEYLDEHGIDPDDRLGKNVESLYPPHLVEEIKPHFEAALRGESRSFETTFEGRHVSADVLPIGETDDDVSVGMLVVQDVTERREMEQELRESEAKFRTLAENLDEIVWMSTADTEDVLYINPVYEDVWGQDRDTLYEDSRAFLDVIHPADRERVADAYARLPDEEYEEEFRVVQPDGETRWVHAEAAPVENDDGEVFRVVGIAEDVTERKEYEQTLEALHGVYRNFARAESRDEIADQLVEAATDVLDLPGVAVYLTDFEGTLEPAAVAGALDEPYRTLPEVDAEAGDSVIGRAFVDNETAVHQDVAPLASHMYTGAHLRRGLFVPMGDHGVLVVGDVNAGEFADETVDLAEILSANAQSALDRLGRERELRERERELQASNERLEQFAYAASHDLQEPLRMVSSYLSLIERRYEDALDEEGEEFLEFAVDGAERMREMIDALLKYSRVETRGDPFEPVDLNDVVENVRTDLRMKIDETAADVTVEPLPEVSGDEDQLRQVFQNLLDNALEYSGDDPPEVRVSAERDGDEWVISVRDHGIGIDESEADDVFEVFERLHTQEEHAGTGIGLALCRRIVERHDGEIWVESAPGEGSTFRFTLPATAPEVSHD